MQSKIKELYDKETIEWLNRNIKKPANYIREKEVCKKCNDNVCHCCGQEIDCYYSDNVEECPKVIKEMAKTKKRYGDFKPDLLKSKALQEGILSPLIKKGIRVLINEDRMIAISNVIPIQAFEDLYGIEYEEIDEPILKVKDLWKKQTTCLVGKPNCFNECEIYILNQLLRLANNPRFFYAKDNPLLLMSNSFIFLMALRVDDDEEDFDYYEDWYDYQEYRILRYIIQLRFYRR